MISFEFEVVIETAHSPNLGYLFQIYDGLEVRLMFRLNLK